MWVFKSLPAISSVSLRAGAGELTFSSRDTVPAFTIQHSISTAGKFSHLYLSCYHYFANAELDCLQRELRVGLAWLSPPGDLAGTDAFILRFALDSFCGTGGNVFTALDMTAMHVDCAGYLKFEREHGVNECHDAKGGSAHACHSSGNSMACPSGAIHSRSLFCAACRSGWSQYKTPEVTSYIPACPKNPSSFTDLPRSPSRSQGKAAAAKYSLIGQCLSQLHTDEQAILATLQENLRRKTFVASLDSTLLAVVKTVEKHPRSSTHNGIRCARWYSSQGKTRTFPLVQRHHQQ